MEISMHGYSEDQLKALHLDAIVKAYAQDAANASMLVSKTEITRTPTRIPGDASTVEKLRSLSQNVRPNKPIGEEVGPAAGELDGQPDLQHSAAAGSSPVSAQEGGIMPIAIIGMSCRFPGGATDIGKFWDLVSEGRSAWSAIPEERFNASAFYHPNADRTDAMNVKAGHFLQRKDFTRFDAPFFNISPNEAKAMDPRARMHLEGAYEALENAGVTLSDVLGSDTAVFVGAFSRDYGDLMLRDPGIAPVYKATGVGISLLSNRISHSFDLRGPSVTLDTACSASMVALHLACECLRKGDSKMALVSGANIILDPDIMLALSTLKFLSPDGKTYMFDQRANGYSRGEGICTLVVKPLSDALKANDPIHAVIRNTRTNQDGRTPGITMPSRDAQRSLIQQTYQEARLSPSDTDFFEAHGTGTQAGDREEAEALSSALGSVNRPPENPLNVGSIKTIIGHTEGCSGVAGIMHAVMALKNKAILPNCNFEIPNNQIKFDACRIKVPTKLEAWLTDHPRRVSVNSFGYGGSNVHVILEEGPEHIANGSISNGAHGIIDGHSTHRRKILCLSANDSGGIERQAKLLTHYLVGDHGQELMDDLVYTLGQRRTLHKHRLAIQADSIRELRSKLHDLVYNPPTASEFKKLIFIFTGQGAQWPRMGCDLLAAYPVFYNTFQIANQYLSGFGATWSLLDELYREPDESQVDEAFISQPLCTAFQIALVELLRSWNIQPSVVVGHSSGEIAAAYTAGMLSLKSAICVAYHRGRLASRMALDNRAPQGAMLAIGLSPEEVRPYIDGLSSGKVTIACINSPRSISVSGDIAAINELHSRLEEKGCFSRKLRVNVAYHSAHMKTIAEDYRRSLGHLDIQSGNHRVRFCSSVFPRSFTETNADYWIENLLSPVLFSEAMEVALKSHMDNDLACIEIGPHSTLSGPFKQICRSLSAGANTEYYPTILRKESGVQQTLNLACSLFHNGWKIDLASINFPTGKVGLRVLTDLPPYSWNHSVEHWHEGRLSHNYLHRMTPPHDLLGTLMDDSSDIDMRWTKYIRQSELPWLKDHVIKSEVILPAAAYLAMAMEATKQKSSINGLEIQGYILRDVIFAKALVVPDTSDGVEVSFILEPLRQSSAASSSNWNEFRVISFGPDRKAFEHCHGLISVNHKANFDFSSSDEATLALMRHDKSMKSGLYEKWLARAKSNGNDMGSSFQLVSKCCLTGEDSFFTLHIPEQSEHESPLTIGVPLMDAFLQVTVLSVIGKVDGLDGAVIPTSIAELVISESIGRDTGHTLHAQASTTEMGPRDFMGQVIAAQEGNNILEPVVQVKGAKFVCIARDREGSQVDDTKTKLCWDVVWDDDVDELQQDDVAERWSLSELSLDESLQTAQCEKAAWYCLRSAYECLTKSDVEKLAPHHRNYYNWMKMRYELGQKGGLPVQKNGLQQEWSRTDLDTIGHNLQDVAVSGAQGCMTIRLGRRLLNILRGEVDPLSLMLEDDLLNRYYAEIRGQHRVYEQAARFVTLAAHKNPRLRILEVGAGTGSATSWLLNALGGYDGKYPRFSSYVFTDISTGFFEKAQTKFRAWGDLVSFKPLNIEEDLKQQGFDETESYDIIAAANVLHATSNMEHTMKHVNKLLKPGGKLVLIEAAPGRRVSSEMVFGLLPGWWLGVSEGRTESPLLSEEQWESLLKRTGYSGLDICLRDSLKEEMWTLSMIVSTKSEEAPGQDLSDVHLIYDSDKNVASVNSIAEDFERSLGVRPLTSTLSETNAFDKFIVVVDHTSRSFLLGLDEGKLEVLKRIFAQAKGVFWITFGGLGIVQNAGAGAVTGLIRTLRSENDGMSYVTCDVEAKYFSKPKTAQSIAKVFVKAFGRSNTTSSVNDFEFSIQDGRIMIPRIVENKPANRAISEQPSKHELEEQLLGQSDSCLCLSMDNLGLLDSFQFVHSDKFSNEIGPDEVEIEVKTVGLNFHDLMVATGQLPDPNGYGVECAGVVTKVGRATHSLSIGDRVCAISPSSFSNRVRASQTLVNVMPKSMTFEVGASIPSVFTVSYYCICHVAYLQKNESILIHSAAGGVGQACIKMAQLVGAEIYVTAGSSEKADFLKKTYGLPRSHILNSRTLDFKYHIMRLTKGKGVDVIINSLAGEALHETWRCLAMFGRFIELGKKDAVQNTRLDMAPFEKSASFISVGWDHFGYHRPQLVGSVFKKVMELFNNEIVTPLEPITTFPMSAVESAFRFMASGNHMGKIVVTADKNCLVKVVPKSMPRFQLRTQASYLIVGGLGGIGVEMAKWMVDAGANSVILISRSGMDAPGAAELVEALKRPGVTITVRKCDVADKENLSAVLQHCTQDLPPIRGIVQGAMVLKDAIFPNMTLTKYYQALDPKIRGSQNLHDLFHQSPDQLDFFVMLSSLGGILGNASQSNYAAGNTYQDALAHYRASTGLPALSIDIGQVIDAGWVAQNPDVISRGVLAMARELRVKDLTALIEHHVRTRGDNPKKAAAQIAIGLDKYPAFDARFSHVGASLAGSLRHKQETHDHARSVESQIAAAGHDRSRLLTVILEAFKQKLGRLLALKVEDVHEDDTIAGHGVDSLVAVEIRNWFRKEVRANVTVFEILNGKLSLKGVVEGVVREMVDG